MIVPRGLDGTPADFDAWCMTVEASHTPLFWADVLLDGVVVHEGLQVTGGSVTLDRRAEHRARVSVDVIEPDLVPTVAAGILAPLGYELQVWRGVEVEGTPVRCSLGCFGITTTKVSGADPGGMTIDGWDRSVRVSDAKLLDTYNWLSGGPLETYIADLVFRGCPWVGSLVQYSFEGALHTTQLQTFERGSDTWRMIQESAKGVGCEAFFDGDGYFRWRPEPDYRNVDPLCDVREGDGGTMITLDLGYSREQAFNVFQVVAENTNDSASIVGTASDTDPNSPTYVSGSFGSKPAPIIRSTTVQTAADATAAAEAQKAQQLGIARTVDVEMVPNPALEPGDAVTLVCAGALVDETALIDEVVMPLDATSPARLTIRAKQDLT